MTINKTLKFIEKVKLKGIHVSDDGALIYNYEHTNYIHSAIKILINCKLHGVFEQTPNHHLAGSGCTICARTTTTHEFISKARNTHGEKYDYSMTVYTGAHNKIKIRCIEHNNTFEQTPSNHISGHGCSKCKKEKLSNTIDNFITTSINVHGDRYDYSEVLYTDAITKVKIKCKTHGTFKQSPNAHMAGQNCPECSAQHRGFTKSKFADLCTKNNKGIGCLYVIRLYNDHEHFYKLGITSRDVVSRFGQSLPYKYDIIYQIFGNPKIIYDTEKLLLKSVKPHKYIPQVKFGGLTECFKDIEHLHTLISPYFKYKKGTHRKCVPW